MPLRSRLLTDIPFLLICGLLLATILGYLFDVLPYPFGVLVLLVLLAARLTHLSLGN